MRFLVSPQRPANAETPDFAAQYESNFENFWQNRCVTNERDSMQPPRRPIPAEPSIPIERGDIFLSDLSGYQIPVPHNIRPVLVVSHDARNRSSNSVIIATCSSVRKGVWLRPSQFILHAGCRTGLKNETIVKCEELFSVKKEYFLKKLGSIRNSQAESDMDKALLFAVGLDESSVSGRII